MKDIALEHVEIAMFENFTCGIYRPRSPHVEKECHRGCRDGVLMLIERAVREPIHKGTREIILTVKHFFFLTCAQRTPVDFCPQHWLLCHLGVYWFEFGFEF